MNPRALPGALVLLLLAAAVYAPLHDAGFLWDDNLWLWDSPITMAADGPVQAFVSADRFDYYPVTSSAFWLAWRVFERGAPGYHALQVVLHALAGWLLWRVLVRLGLPGAWVAAAVFVVHPVAVASVAWISEIKNTLSLVLMLGSVLAWLRAEPGHRGAYAVSLALFVAALLAKASAVVVPVWLLALAWIRTGRVTGRDLARVAPYGVLAVAAGWVTVRLQVERAIGSELVAGEPFVAQLAIAARALGFYFAKAVAPFGLAIVYPRWETPSGPDLWIPGLVLAAVAAGLAGLALRGRRGPAGAAVMWAAALAPTLGFVAMYYTIYSRVADHWAYHALPVVVAALVGGATAGLRRLGVPSRVPPGIAVVVVLALGALSARQAAAYRTPETMWRHVLVHQPESWTAHHQLAIHHARAGDAEEAERLFREAIRIRPDYALAHRNLAHQYELMERDDDAIREYQAALEIAPHYLEARLALGNLLLRHDRDSEARDHLEQVVAGAPGSFEAWLYLGTARSRLADPDGAHEALENAIALNPNHFEARYSLAKVFFQMGEIELAIAELENVLALDPDHVEAAQVLEMLRQRAGGGQP